MKTPLDNFEFEYQTANFEHFSRLAVTATHKTLDVVFARRFDQTNRIPLDSNVKIMELTLSICKDITRAALYNKTALYVSNSPMGTELVYLNQPEWDKEKEAWFILDKNNNKVYEN